MMNQDEFLRFAKENILANLPLTLNAVIYTRVSSKEQFEENKSLEWQKKGCEEYAKRKGYNVIACFGGTYESAQTDERKEFKRMLEFLKKSKEKISYIIVQSIDRFSRSGDNAIYISNELKKNRIFIKSVTQEIESQSPSGSFQEKILFLFSQFDNDTRREKTISGMTNLLRKGYWATKAPMGYLHIKGADRDNRLVVDSKIGKLIKKAFELKAEEQLSNAEIARILKNQGLEITKNR